ncbi:uncharacterized protein TNCV_2771211 [Trichonephila clavipes]|nr:uncharacterized protein TNCV_2771211 [Trichonephila clavipes]
MKEVSQTFDGISKKFLKMISQFKSPGIDIVFDQYFTPSIKYCERLRRNETTSTVSIGPNQIRHHNFAGELKNTQFKEALAKMLIDHWTNDNMYPFIGNKTIYLRFDKRVLFVSRVCVVNKVIRSIEESLSCDEHEAETRIIYHICQISVDAQVVVRCSDSNILIKFLGNLDHLNASLKLWIQWGVGNHERLISINDLYQDLCTSLSKALPCFHAITGCDYTPAFFRKGKLRPFKLLEKSVEYHLACQEIITEDDDEIERIFATLEKFIWHISCTMTPREDFKRYEVVIFKIMRPSTYRPTDHFRKLNSIILEELLVILGAWEEILKVHSGLCLEATRLSSRTL